MMTPESITNLAQGFWRGWYGTAPCPICQSERRHDQKALSISSDGKNVLLFCHKRGCGFKEILDALGVRALPRCQSEELPAFREERKRRSTATLSQARAVWNASIKIQGSVAETYLRRRGIACELPSSLRVHNNCYYGPTQSRQIAMIADVLPTGGVHRTFLKADGHRLPSPSKMMLGPCAGGAVHCSTGSGPLVVCEGIETALSLASGMLTGSPSIWAALSTSGMKSLILPEKAHTLIVATDGDEPGRLAGQILAEKATHKGWEVKFLHAPNHQDWNGVLRKGASNV
ncbi:MAG: toprim domain-containing protein [Shimia thalassica]